jgi:hypothetical protein
LIVPSALLFAGLVQSVSGAADEKFNLTAGSFWFEVTEFTIKRQRYYPVH